jgi:hypothetical protein
MAAKSEISSVIQTALQRKKLLQAEVQACMEKIAITQAEMNAATQAISRIDVMIKEIQASLPNSQKPGISEPTITNYESTSGTGLTKAAGFGNSQAFFEQIAREAILQNGRPMQTSEILKAFRDRGHPIEGNNPWKIASNNLWKAKAAGRLIHRIGTGYWPADVANLALAYAPPPEGAAPLKLRPAKLESRKSRSTGRPPGRSRALSPEQIQLAKKWWSEGKQGTDIARQLGGVSMGTLYRYLREAGVPARKKKPGGGRKKKKVDMSK